MGETVIDDRAPVVATEAGLARGKRTGGVASFAGIPYAAAPVGHLRFALPEPPQSWPGVRDALQLGPNAPQRPRVIPGLDVTPIIGNGWRPGPEFLSLDLYSPDPQPAARLPVMVFIHGGAFVVGSKDAPVHNGAAFARCGIVCISINYRMGVEGFLPISGAPTNLGLRDQLAALRWVRDNVAAFGGDPRNITVFGESAGAMSIANLLTSPLARGLFGRAIIQSGHGSMVRPIEVAERLTRQLARMLGVTADLKGFASRTVEQCLEVLERIQDPTAPIDLRDGEGHDPAYGLTRFLPVYGDEVLPDHPLEALAWGAAREVQLLIGTTREEMNTHLVPTGIERKINQEQARAMLGKWHPEPDAVLASYGMDRPGAHPGAVLAEAMHDLVFRLPARSFAESHRGRTHFYEFGWRSPALGGELGACHALELPFVFDTLACCSGADAIAGPAPPQALADRMHEIWAGFARDGSLPWQQYGPARRVFAIENDCTVIDPVMPASRRFARGAPSAR